MLTPPPLVRRVQCVKTERITHRAGTQYAKLLFLKLYITILQFSLRNQTNVLYKVNH